MIVGADESVLVQGMTGRQGSYWTGRMLGCGTRVVAGASPKRGGHEVHGRPVYDSAAAAAADHDLDATVMFVPPAGALAATVDAVEAGIGKVVCLAEHIPAQDVLEMLAVARANGARVLGPNTAGLVVPGESSVGIMPGFAPTIFRPGTVGVVSRSGSLGTLICMSLVRDGLGQRAFIGVGGDPVVGTSTAQAVRTLLDHPCTRALVVVGEIGGAMEEEAADLVAGLELPVVAFIAGRTAPPDTRMGHAGAIVSAGRGSGESKVKALTEAGAVVVDVPSQIGEALRSAGVTLRT